MLFAFFCFLGFFFLKFSAEEAVAFCIYVGCKEALPTWQDEMEPVRFCNQTERKDSNPTDGK